MQRNENGQLEPGTLLAGRYRVERFLAGGGMGLVYVARDQRLADRRCAVKEIFDRFTNSEERARAVEYFHREADTLARLNHPAIPAIVDRFGEGNCHYLVMDFVEGTNLEDDLAALGGSLPESRVIDIARELCDVLSYLHGFRPPIVYRDMKPGNVILTPGGRVALIDFGIARIFTPQGKATLIGTPGFAPPEQYAGSVDPRSDVYGLAGMLHYMLTGRDPEKHPPFSFPPVHSLKPDASPFLARAIDQALSYAVAERPGSAAAFKEMLLYGRGLSASPVTLAAKAATQPLRPLSLPIAEPGVAPTPRSGRRWPRGVAALLLLGLLAGGGYGAYTHPELLDPASLARFGERIPWQKVEAVLPEGRREQFRQFVAGLPWEREKRLRALRADPLEVMSLKVVNTARDGSPLPDQKAAYTENEVQYLTWEAVLKNRLAGVEAATYRLEGRFFDPDGGLAGKSEAGRAVRPDEPQLEVRGITLLEGLKERAKGDYQLELFLGDKKLASGTVRIEAEAKQVVKAKRPEGRAPMPAAAEVTRGVGSAPDPAEMELERLAKEAKKQTLIAERSKKPLQLLRVRFLNTAKDGKHLSPPGAAFPASQVRFVSWEAVFQNRLRDLMPAYHRVEATFYTPNGQPLGTVQDAKEVAVDKGEVMFTARIGNSHGGAFTPGTYKVDFYVNGWPLSSRQFTVTDDQAATAAVEPLHRSDAGGGAPTAAHTPLELIDIRFLNTEKDGTPLSPAGDAFPAARVRFITWEVLFRNRQRGTTPTPYRVEAQYLAPDGRRLGTTQDTQEIGGESRALFTGRIGNSGGGAFGPGTYKVEFTLNGKPLSSRRFTVQGGGGAEGGRADAPRAAAPRRDPPPGDLASLLRRHSGSMLGLVMGREVGVEIDFRPHPDGSLTGDLTIHEPGYGVVAIAGRADGNRVEFHGSLGRDTYHFHGWRDEDRLGGSYTVSPSGSEGRWSVRLMRGPTS